MFKSTQFYWMQPALLACRPVLGKLEAIFKTALWRESRDQVGSLDEKKKTPVANTLVREYLKDIHVNSWTLCMAKYASFRMVIMFFFCCKKGKYCRAGVYWPGLHGAEPRT
jgi:hypothetical protein